MKMDICKFFYDISMAEQGGFGIWYEYLAKYRIFKKFDAKRILIFGLPEKYSLGLDTLYFSGISEMDIVDERKKNLERYKDFAKKFNKKIKTINKNLKIFNNKNYDLVISTEVIQNNLSLFKKIKSLGKTIVIFVPNKQCYAHPKISKLNSMSLKELENLGKKQSLKLKEKGYIDCPPWPAGACLPKEEDINKKESIIIKMIKKTLIKITPFLARLDKFYPSPWKELNSHMVYCVFENEQ